MNVRRLTVQPSVLRWARTTAGLSVDEAARRIGVRPRRIEEWESEELDPTINQLRTAARAYDRPLAALFLSQPPQNEEIFDLPDFRRPSAVGGESAFLRRAILRARRQQDALQEVIEEGSEMAMPTATPIEINPDDPASESGKTIRKALGLKALPARTVGNPDLMLRLLVRKVEDLGYLVIQVQRVPVEEMRGFSLAGGPAPVIALNGADWPRGKIFTLIHELAHVGTRTSGLCDLSRESRQPEERYCDAVAAAALMPASAFRAAAAGVDPGDLRGLRDLAQLFGVSAEASLLRMVNLKLATWDQYFDMKAEFRDAYAKYKQDERDANADKDAPIFYQLKVRDLGRPFIRTVLRAHDDGAISARDVTNLLELSYDKLPKLAAATGAGAQ